MAGSNVCWSGSAEGIYYRREGKIGTYTSSVGITHGPHLCFFNRIAPVAHFRTLIILWRLFPLAISFRRDFARWVFFGHPLRRSREFHSRRAAALVNALVTLGPTFVKLAQVFASRPDVVPEPYLSTLGTLVDRVPVVPFDQIEREIVNAYGQRPEEMFSDFDREPLASGSLGQVYRARYEGRDIVVRCSARGWRNSSLPISMR